VANTATRRTNAGRLLAVFVTTTGGTIVEVQAVDIGPIRFKAKMVAEKKSA
jgi:hypothetical protein